MKIIRKSMRQGRIVVAVQSLDDLWHLSQVIEPGDLVSGKTTRKVKAAEKDAAKKTLTLKLRAETVDFKDKTLRIGGITAEENEDIPKGSHHTIAVEENSVISVTKEKWPQYALKRLKLAAEKQARSLILVLDREEALFALLKSQGYEILSQLKGKVAKKSVDNSAVSDFYRELADKLGDYDSRLNPDSIIVASPAFWKDDFVERVSSELRKRVVLAACSSVGVNAIEEVLKRPELREVMRQQRAAEESRVVEQLMAEIGRDGLAAYGMNEVRNAVDSGNVKQLLITDAFIAGNRKGSEAFMKDAESVKGEVVIINSENEAGKKLDSLGGVAVLARYRF